MKAVTAAIQNLFGVISGGVEKRKKIRKDVEKSIAFGVKKTKKRKVKSYTLQTGRMVGVDGENLIKDIVLLEDGYIPGHEILLERGATKAAYEAWKADPKPLLVNINHTKFSENMMAATVGAIVDMRLENLTDGNGKKRGRLIVDVELDLENPYSKWLVALDRNMKKAGLDSILSVSAEFVTKDFKQVESNGQSMISIEDYVVTGMALTLDPANVTSFKSIKSLNDTESSTKKLSKLNQKPTMEREEKLEAKAEEVRTEEVRTEEVKVEEVKVEEAKVEEVKTEEVKTDKSDSEADTDGEKADKADSGDDVNTENESVKEDSVDTDGVAVQALEAANRAVETVEVYKVKLAELQEKLENVQGEIVEREDGGNQEKTPEPSVAQKIASGLQ